MHPPDISQVEFSRHRAGPNRMFHSRSRKNNQGAQNEHPDQPEACLDYYTSSFRELLSVNLRRNG